MLSTSPLHFTTMACKTANVSLLTAMPVDEAVAMLSTGVLNHAYIGHIGTLLSEIPHSQLDKVVDEVALSSNKQRVDILINISKINKTIGPIPMVKAFVVDRVWNL